MTGSKVVALGHYQPERVLTNAELATMVETNDEWIQSRVGIKERRIAAPDEQVDEMAWRAAEKAVANAGIDSAEIDLVVVATCTALDRSPNIAARVAARLGLGSPAALDVNTACSGFSHALATADHAIRAGAASKALVIGVEKLSDFTDWTDRTTCVLIGDGAGAAVAGRHRRAGDRPGRVGFGAGDVGRGPDRGPRRQRSPRKARASSAGPPPNCR